MNEHARPYYQDIIDELKTGIIDSCIVQGQCNVFWLEPNTRPDLSGCEAGDFYCNRLGLEIYTMVDN
jgi:hypothetical protein